jgi:serine protease AprX
LIPKKSKTPKKITVNFIFKWIAVLAVILLFISGGGLISANSASNWGDKVDPQVLIAASSGSTDFLVIMATQADLEAAAALETKTEKGTFVYETLSELATASQRQILAELDSLGVEYEPYWIINMMWVRGNLNTIQRIARRAEVAQISANSHIQGDIPKNQVANLSQAIEAVTWGVNQVNAPQVWNLGYTGEGIIIGGQDTGYIWDHEALKDQYRGWDGNSVDHNFNWFDPVISTTVPVDPHGHGTHTMGTMIGDDSGGTAIGVAPGAQWIGCRNMDASGVGSPATYAACYQWFIAPTDLNGENPDPTKAPHVINNSWACPASENCTVTALITATKNVRAAGIMTVHSAGNSGSGCGTVNTPAAIYAESFSVGATDSNNSIASFSSRGPVTIDGSNRRKPDISAPGVSIWSSTKDGSYGYSSGTSMAAPHVAGVVALLLSANPSLIGDVNEIEALLQVSAKPLFTNDSCGGDQPDTHPNHTFGYGLIDSWAAFQRTMEIVYFPLILK